MWRFKELKRSIKNLWKWFPIIWKDRDWDHWYIYQIIEFKLRKQSDYTSKVDIHTRAQEDARDMLICANLINKIKDGFYDSEYIDYHESEFEFLDIEDKPGFSELKINEISEDYDSYFKKYPNWYKRAINYIKENQSRYNTDYNDKKLVAMVMGDLRQQKAKELVFKIISNKIEGWWC
jgi:hypothetical protein